MTDDYIDWRSRAACIGRAKLFFPRHGGNFDAAKAICRSCPVRQDCLDEALRLNIEWGIWGGLSRPQRNKLRRGEVA